MKKDNKGNFSGIFRDFSKISETQEIRLKREEITKRKIDNEAQMLQKVTNDNTMEIATNKHLYERKYRETQTFVMNNVSSNVIREFRKLSVDHKLSQPKFFALLVDFYKVNSRKN